MNEEKEKKTAGLFFNKALSIGFRFVVLPILLLFAIELTAGMFTKVPVSLFIKEKIPDGPEFYRVNYQAGYRFFPGRMARKPLAEFFPAKKTEKRLRIFVLGESAARGESLSDFSFARMLEAALNKGSSDRRAEVINTGIPAINSWVLREFTREIINYEPDLIIVYAGHNEFIGPFGPSGFSRFRADRNAILTGIWASSLNITRLLKSEKTPQNLKTGWKGLEMFFQNRLNPGDKAIEDCLANWQQNISDIFAMAQAEKIPVVWCPVPVNAADCPPFLSDDSKMKESEKIEISDLVKEIAMSNSSERNEELKKLNEKFPDHALLNYLYGKSLLSSGKISEARNYLLKAVANDCFIVRATPQLNIRAKAAAEKFKATTADIVAAFENESENGIIGEKLVYDHVHLTEYGHYIAARAIWQSIQSSDIPCRKDFQGEFPDFDSLKNIIGFTDSDAVSNLQRIIQSMSQPPFTLQFASEGRLKKFSDELQKIKTGLNVENDISQTMQALKTQPYNAAMSHRIGLLFEHGPAAIEYLKLSTQHNPFNIDTWNNLGLALMKSGLTDQAEACFYKALSLAPDFARAHFNLANLLNEKQQTEKAMSHFWEAIESDPGITAAWRNLANMHFRQKNFNKALEIYQSAAIAVPEDLLSQIGIGNCLVELNRNEEAVKHFTALCSSFSSPLPQFSLGLVREKNRQFKEAAEAYLNAGQQGHENSLQKILNLHISGNIKLSDNEFSEISEKLCIIQNFSDPWTMQVYASALLNQNKKQEALAILFRARDMALKAADNRLAGEISNNIKEIQKP